MKKLMNGALFLAILGTLLIGCEKDELSPTKSVNSIESSENGKIASKSKITNKAAGKYFDCTGGDPGGTGPCPSGGCVSGGSGCLETVDVEAAFTTEEYNGFKGAIDGNSTNIANFFNGSSWQNLFPYLADSDNSDELSNLQSGDYDIIVAKEGSEMEYFMVGEATNLSIYNYEFVLTLDVSDL